MDGYLNNKTMKTNIRTGLCALTTVIVLSLQILTLNDFDLGTIIILIIQMLIVGLLFLSKKFGWWVFTLIYGLISILLFLHVFVLNDSGLRNSAVAAIVIITTGYIILHRPTRNYYLKK
jgi:hypothetical protein